LAGTDELGQPKPSISRRNFDRSAEMAKRKHTMERPGCGLEIMIRFVTLPVSWNQFIRGLLVVVIIIAIVFTQPAGHNLPGIITILLGATLTGLTNRHVLSPGQSDPETTS
jgi:hypothetical protein